VVFSENQVFPILELTLTRRLVGSDIEGYVLPLFTSLSHFQRKRTMLKMSKKIRQLHCTQQPWNLKWVLNATR